jgi:outer membrane protein assembly factor BamB
MALVMVCSCKQNRTPNVPDVPVGSERCYKGTTYTFTTIATDPDGDSVAVRFDWGDSTVSYWSGWFESGDTIALTHAWSDTGTFEVRATAQDLMHHTSGPSGELTVRVALRWPPNTPAEPSGPGVGGKDSSYTFTTFASHPGGATVAIRFAWGDGDTSDWSPFVASAESVAMNHSWSAPDTYSVTAQARDTGNALSCWSLPHDVIIRPLDTLRKWRFRLATGYDLSLPSSPAIAPDGTIYVGSPDSSLYAINPDGTLKWRYATGGSVRSSPSIAADGTVYVGSCDYHVYAIKPDGTLKWRRWVPDQVTSCPAIGFDGTVYFGARNEFYARKPDGGGVSGWSYQPPYEVRMSTSAAIASDGTIHFASLDGGVFALWPDGTPQWFHYLGICLGLNPTDPAIAGDGTIYIGHEFVEYYNFTAWNPDGSRKWWYCAGRDVRSSPAVAADGTIYSGSSDNNLYALNPDGTLKWRYQTGGDVDAGPAIAADGTVYVGSDDNCLYAVNTDGTLKWRYETGGEVEAAPTIGTDGTVYFVSDDGYLYALHGPSPLADAPWPKAHHDLQNTGRAAGDGHWSRMDVHGMPITAPDSSGFTVYVANVGNTEVTISSLEFIAAPDSAYMRDFLVDSARGYGYPIPTGQPGTKPIDTLLFTPVTVAPNWSQDVELAFLDFHVDSRGIDVHTNVVGKEFRFRFPDRWEMVVRPR